MKQYIEHIIEHKKKYILSLSTFLLLLPLLLNFLNSKAVLVGAESYFHLLGFELTPWNYVIEWTPHSLLIFFPLFIGTLTILLFLRIATIIKLDQKITVIFLLLTITSAGFIFAYSTISTYTLYLFFVALGFWLALQKKLRFFSLIPFALAGLFDTFSSLLLLGLLVIFVGTKLKDLFRWSVFVVVGIVTGISFLTKSFVLGPFYEYQALPHLFSDLGALSGVSSFVVMLAIIGITVTWKKRRLYTSYGLAAGTIAAYCIFPQTILIMTLTICFFAAVALAYLYEREWKLAKLKHYTFLLIMLGLIFSSISYLDRVSEIGLSENDHKALSWINENLGHQKLLTSPENSYQVKYFTKANPLDYPHQRINFQGTALDELYIRQLFPVLEFNEVKLVFISENMKKELPSDQGLLFLLRNERFKLVHSSGNAEVWSFDS
ncbi:MAG: hypothetical protein ISS01_02645 [Nanoarchaeota archaeon]|nr:hypothetical protein [Nanoarchaeota archaeon]